LENAQNTALRIGAYHFFSYDSGGITQAENFIKTVPQNKHTLPPVIDVEFYGDKEQKPPDQSQVERATINGGNAGKTLSKTRYSLHHSKIV
jgi:lysozyme